MDQNQQQSDSKVTIEELLKLKKHEQPDDAFWNRFEKDLQRKTLKTLIKQPSFKEKFIGLLGQIPLPNRGIIAITPALALLAISISPISAFFTDNTQSNPKPALPAVENYNPVALIETVSTNQKEDLTQLVKKSEANFVIETISIKDNTIETEYYKDFTDGSVMLLTQDSTMYVTDNVSLTGSSTNYLSNSLF